MNQTGDDERRTRRLRQAVVELDLAASPVEREALRETAARHFAAAMAALYAGEELPGEALVRAVFAACGTGAARLLPQEWGRHVFVHQFLTREFADALAGHLHALGAAPVLEVGAGQGELSRQLRSRGVPIVATDDGSWLDGRYGWPADMPPDVVRRTYRDALQRYQPAVVLCCWMPFGEDWTPAFRTCPSVRTYLLVGEAPGGSTATRQAYSAPEPWRREALAAVAALGITRNVEYGSRAAVYQFTHDQ
jgi:hypothetical protein